MASELAVDSTALEFARRPGRMLIGGSWLEARADDTLPTVNPATGEVLTHVPAGTEADVDAAVAAARAAFEDSSWRHMKPTERTQVLWRIADLVDEHAEEIALLETLDVGTPLPIMRGATAGTAGAFRYWAGWPTKVEGITVPISAPGDYHVYTRPEPVGVVAAIVPWNFPTAMAAWKVAPALALGNTIVVKPAEQTPLATLRLAELLLEAGVPPGVFNVVTGTGPQAGAALAAHPGVDKVTFTGSVETGKLIVQAAAGNLKRVSLELGGKSPNIVFDDADLELAIPGAAFAAFFNQGEACTAGSRLYVHAKVFDEVMSGIVEEARKLRVGSGLEPTTDLGPLISHDQLERVSAYVEEGLAEGARASVGGSPIESDGYFYEPTVLVDVRPEMSVVKEEIFGPVVVAAPFTDEIDVLRTANDSRYGLSAAVWTTNVNRAHRAAAELQAGTVWVNCYHVLDMALPFGGLKESGWGRELGRQAIELYTETKAVVARL